MQHQVPITLWLNGGQTLTVAMSIVARKVRTVSVRVSGNQLLLKKVVFQFMHRVK